MTNRIKNYNKSGFATLVFHEQGTLLKVQRATRSVYFIYLHYRIINRIIATNTYLVKIKISNDKMCTFCKQENETIAHLFWKCPVTQTFVKQVDDELYNKIQNTLPT